MLKRTVDFTRGNILACDSFSDDDVLFEILKGLGNIEFPIGKLYLPFTPLDNVEITADDLHYASADSDVQYVILCNTMEASDEAKKMLECVIKNDLAFSFAADGTPYASDSCIGMFYNNVIVVPAAGDNRESICARIVGILEAMGGDETACKLAEYADYKNKVIEDTLQKFVSQQKERRIMEFKSSIESDKNSLRSYSKNIVDLTRRIATYEAELIGLEMSKDRDTSKIKADIAELMSYSTLEDIVIQLPDKLVFKTGYVALKENNGLNRPLGKYDVVINMQNCSVVFTNKDNKINKVLWGHNSLIPHPHCSESGTPCLGNLGTILPDLVGANDILGIWQVILGFLTSYNPTDAWGKRAIYWDLCNHDGTPAANTVTKCAICGKAIIIDEDDHIQCGICGRIVCEDCAAYNEEDSDYYCIDCNDALYCNTCNTSHGRETEFTTCEYCGNRICKMEALHDEVSGYYFCNEKCHNIHEAALPEEHEEPGGTLVDYDDEGAAE